VSTCHFHAKRPNAAVSWIGSGEPYDPTILVPNKDARISYEPLITIEGNAGRILQHVRQPASVGQTNLDPNFPRRTVERPV
jgi:hypothetical protein